MPPKKLADDDELKIARKEARRLKTLERRRLKRKVAKIERTIMPDETESERRARVKKEMHEKVKNAIEMEEKKAHLLASDIMTKNTMLGMPEGGPISKAGKLTLAAIERIAQLGFDPLEQSVRIAQGKMLKEDHAFLPEFKAVLDEWYDTLESFDAIDMDDLERFRKMGIKALTRSTTPADLRSKHTLELIQYIYPKRKAMEMAVQTDRAPLLVTTLTEYEVEVFRSKYQGRY